MNNHQLIRDLRSFTHPGPNDDISHARGVKVMDHALRTIEEQEELIAELTAVWKDEVCWRKESMGPCGTCKACRTRTALLAAGLVTPEPEPGHTLFDL